MKKTLEIINELKVKGLIEDYAIGEGVASIFYTEPFFTQDIDIFILVKPDASKNIISLTKIFQYLENKGYVWKGGHIVVEGMPIQFIPVDGGIEEEALRESREITYQGVKTNILTAKYLIAIALNVGRRKDFERIEKILDQYKVNMKNLKSIFKRHNLYEKFQDWKKKDRN